MSLTFDAVRVSLLSAGSITVIEVPAVVRAALHPVPKPSVEGWIALRFHVLFPVTEGEPHVWTVLAAF
ncbi:hypothetical protein [Sedimentitalea arenosa]|uniref:hypothetical protein n=1 Tax=Sedimentitalea arenosa TaxID=2798803 RepID=UPI0018ECD19D|nr:hypothetical protein [Arenibacterium arenosum]